MARSGASGGARQPLSRQRPGKAVKQKSGTGTTGKPASRKAAAPKGAAGKAPARKAAGKTGAPKSLARTVAKNVARALAGEPLRAHATDLHGRLTTLYPDAHCELAYRNPFELLIATILSAQTTDRQVNLATPGLFAAYPTARALAEAPLERVEELVKSTGFYRMKARNIQRTAQALVERHGGEVPADMEALVQLPGVGRKTANVVLGNAFNVNHGVVVDTHVGRLATRLGLTAETDPVKVEEALKPLFPQESWTMLSHLLIFHGRRVCDAKRPRCGDCTLADVCPSAVR